MKDVEPIVRSELELMIPRTKTAPEWAQVVRRADRGGSPRRILLRPAVLATALIGGAVIAAGAYGVVQLVGTDHPFPEPTGPAQTVATIRTLHTHRPIVLQVWPAADGKRGLTLITPGGTIPW